MIEVGLDVTIPGQPQLLTHCPSCRQSRRLVHGFGERSYVLIIERDRLSIDEKFGSCLGDTKSDQRVERIIRNNNDATVTGVRSDTSD